MRSPLPALSRLQRLPNLTRLADQARKLLAPVVEVAPGRDTATDAGCRECGGDAIPDQRVPDPVQFVPDPRRDGNTPVKEITTVDAPMVWCATCRTWLHAIGCNSTHHHAGWEPYREPR